MGMESKMDVYKKLHSDHFPNTLFIEQGTEETELESRFKASGIAFPCIVKPDIGMKALAVEKVYNFPMLKDYANRLNGDFLVQELVSFEQEIGVFYCRVPGNNSGKITGVVLKEFLFVTGDNRHTLGELILNNPRAALQWKSLKKKYKYDLQTVLSFGEKCVLVPFGSHTRGAKFIDITYNIDERLHKIIDDVCIKMDGFYFGRLDIRFDRWDAFLEKKEFSIIEVNGAGSEPTHMYDPSHSLWFAWREIIKHWKLLFEISQLNHSCGYPYSSFSEGFWMITQSKKLEKRLHQMTT